MLARSAILLLLACSAAALVLDNYDRLTGSAMPLGRLQNPAAPMRISAS